MKRNWMMLALLALTLSVSTPTMAQAVKGSKSQTCCNSQKETKNKTCKKQSTCNKACKKEAASKCNEKCTHKCKGKCTKGCNGKIQKDCKMKCTKECKNKKNK